jgi:hypothetical protein
MIRAIFSLLALFAASAANAQAPAVQPASRPVPLVSGYCLPVSAGFLESEAKASEEMRKCARGDTVVIPAQSAGSVARMCDFSKSIVAVAGNVVCAMVFPERGSK